MGWDEIANSVCPIARSLAVLGDRWTMLLIREFFLGTRRFDALQAQTGMSSHLLASRLKRLERAGIIERRQYQARPPRYEYRLTPKGLDLHGVVLALRAWGMRWSGLDPDGEPAVALIHKTCGSAISDLTFHHDCGQVLLPQDIQTTFGDAFRAERLARSTRTAKDAAEAP